MTPTPRTNAAIMTGYFGDSSPVVPADFARELEREISVYRECLRERVFWTGGKGQYSREGYSLNVDPETAYRDIDYRNAPLYPTDDEAIDAFVSEMKAHLEQQAARSALGESSSAPEPVPGQKNASTGRTGAREGI